MAEDHRIQEWIEGSIYYESARDAHDPLLEDRQAASYWNQHVLEWLRVKYRGCVELDIILPASNVPSQNSHVKRCIDHYLNLSLSQILALDTNGHNCDSFYKVMKEYIIPNVQAENTFSDYSVSPNRQREPSIESITSEFQRMSPSPPQRPRQIPPISGQLHPASSNSPWSLSPPHPQLSPTFYRHEPHSATSNGPWNYGNATAQTQQLPWNGIPFPYPYHRLPGGPQLPYRLANNPISSLIPPAQYTTPVYAQPYAINSTSDHVPSGSGTSRSASGRSHSPRPVTPPAVASSSRQRPRTLEHPEGNVTAIAKAFLQKLTAILLTDSHLQNFMNTIPIGREHTFEIPYAQDKLKEQERLREQEKLKQREMSKDQKKSKRLKKHKDHIKAIADLTMKFEMSGGTAHIPIEAKRHTSSNILDILPQEVAELLGMAYQIRSTRRRDSTRDVQAFCITFHGTTTYISSLTLTVKQLTRIKTVGNLGRERLRVLRSLPYDLTSVSDQREFALAVMGVIHNVMSQYTRFDKAVEHLAQYWYS